MCGVMGGTRTHLRGKEPSRNTGYINVTVRDVSSETHLNDAISSVKQSSSSRPFPHHCVRRREKRWWAAVRESVGKWAHALSCDSSPAACVVASLLILMSHDASNVSRPLLDTGSENCLETAYKRLLQDLCQHLALTAMSSCRSSSQAITWKQLIQ